MAPGPTVTGMSPAVGPWGTTVEITGTNFGTILTPGRAVAFDGSAGANGFIIDTWSDTHIKGRVAFPATGSVAVHTPAGEADAGDFATSMTYTPSSAMDVSAAVDGLVLSTGDAIGIYHQYELTNQAALAVFSGPDARVYPLDNVVDPNDKYGAIFAKLVEADDHTPLALATQQDHMVSAFGVSGGHLVTTATGINGHVLAAGRDTTGVYAWIDTDSGLVRARPGTTSWATDAGPIQITAKALTGAIAPDGTLWIVESAPGSSQTAYVSVQELAPGANNLSTLVHADATAYANEISTATIQIASDGKQAVIAGTADAQGTPTTFATACDKTSAWSTPPALPGLAQYAFFGQTLGAITNDPLAKTTALVNDVTDSVSTQVIPVWPMQSAGVIVDSAGKAHPLLSNGSVTYALAPPQ